MKTIFYILFNIQLLFFYNVVKSEIILESGVDHVSKLMSDPLWKKELNSNIGNKIIINDFYIWAYDDYDWVSGGNLIVINDDSLGTDSRITCSISPEQGDIFMEHRQRISVYIEGVIRAFDNYDGLRIEPCIISHELFPIIKTDEKQLEDSNFENEDELLIQIEFHENEIKKLRAQITKINEQKKQKLIESGGGKLFIIFDNSISDRKCKDDWTKRGELDVGMYDYCMREQKEGYDDAKYLYENELSSYPWAAEVAEYYLDSWSDQSKGTVDYNMFGYSLDQAYESWLNAEYMLSNGEVDQSSFNKCFDKWFPQIDMVDYCLED